MPEIHAERPQLLLPSSVGVWLGIGRSELPAHARVLSRPPG